MLRSAKGARDATAAPTQPPKSPLKASSKQQPADMVRLDNQIVAPAVEAHNVSTMSVAAAAGAAAWKPSNAGMSSVSSLASADSQVQNPAGTSTFALGGPHINSTASLAGAGRAYQGASAMSSFTNVAGPGANLGIFDSIVEGASLTSLNVAGATSGQPSKSGGVVLFSISKKEMLTPSGGFKTLQRRLRANFKIGLYETTFGRT
ncbi:hypothetical protein HK405_005928 [Cladochytrium tenue]|nr:hypothetical protein HK405_005928 [Cladochytrium tenue]